LSFLAVSFSLLAALASFDGLTGAAAALVAVAAEVLAGVIAACAFAGAWFSLVGAGAFLVGTIFTSGLLAAAFPGATVAFAGVVATFAGMTAGFAGVVAVLAGLVVVFAVAGTIAGLAGAAAGFVFAVALLTGAGVVFAGTLTGLIEITAGFGPVCTVAAEGFDLLAGVLAAVVLFVFELLAGLCAQQAPAVSANTTMPVVSFIRSPTSSPQLGRVCPCPPDPDRG
jgi:hypothetical protein